MAFWKLASKLCRRRNLHLSFEDDATELPITLSFPGKYGNVRRRWQELRTWYSLRSSLPSYHLHLQDDRFLTSFFIKILYAFLVPISELYMHIVWVGIAQSV